MRKNMVFIQDLLPKRSILITRQCWIPVWKEVKLVESFDMSQCFLLLVVGAASYVLLSGLPAVAQEDIISKMMEKFFEAMAGDPSDPSRQPPPGMGQEPHSPFNHNPFTDQNPPPPSYHPQPPYDNPPGDPAYPRRDQPPGGPAYPRRDQPPGGPAYPRRDQPPGGPAYPRRDQPPGEQFPPQYPHHPPSPPLSQQGPVEPPNEPMNPLRSDHPSQNPPQRDFNPWNPHGWPRRPPFPRRRRPPHLWPRRQYPLPPNPERPPPPDSFQPDKQPIQPAPVITYEATSEAPSSYVTPAPTVTSTESNAICSDNLSSFTECVNPFNNCGALCEGGMKDDFVTGWSVTAWCCRPGCDCQPGFKRNENGTCIDAELCPKCPEDDSNKNHNLTESFSR